MRRVLQIFWDGTPQKSSLTEPLLDGEQGNRQTLEAMAEIVRLDRMRPDVRKWLLRDVIGDISGHRPLAQVDRIFEYAQHRIRYQQDPVDMERVADMWSTLYALNPDPRGMPEGDCGIKSTFIATCCALLGHKPFFAVVKQRANQRAYNHVYNGIVIGGQVYYRDATPEDKPAGYEPAAYEKAMFPIF